MPPIPWPTIIQALVDDGLTQPEIARLCGCGQSTVSDLLNGSTKDPRTSTGLLLLGLARERGVFDPTWPHPQGRPAIDVAGPVEVSHDDALASSAPAEVRDAA